jgi:hypothetical protein
MFYNFTYVCLGLFTLATMQNNYHVFHNFYKKNNQIAFPAFASDDVPEEIIIGFILINLAAFSFPESKKSISNPYHTPYGLMFPFAESIRFIFHIAQTSHYHG